MTKQEATKDAQKYANISNITVYVLRRGSKYQASSIDKPGWVVAEIIKPESKG